MLEKVNIKTVTLEKVSPIEVLAGFTAGNIACLFMIIICSNFSLK